MFEEQHQEALAELEGAGELAKDLPHTVQEEQKDRSLLARLAVGVRRLGTALLEWVTCLGVSEDQRRERGGNKSRKDHSQPIRLNHFEKGY